ncbi:MAG: CPBP family intramembrane metalloprotease [Planctomycetes bacterium]|nr:CPBP family intramembrane metalloprotease [Planctomycetota bacterium]
MYQDWSDDHSVLPRTEPTPAPWNMPLVAELVEPRGPDVGTAEEPILAIPVSIERPRIWSVVLLYVASLLASLVVTSVVMVFVIRWKYGVLTPQQVADLRPQLASFFETRLGFIVMVLPNQLTLAALALGAALLSPLAFRDRLGLRPSHLPVWSWLLMAAATPVVGMTTSMFMNLFTTDRGENMEMLQRIFKAHSGPFFLVMTLLIGVLPGLCEELLFRGYMQTRLLARFPAWVAIGVSALAFAAAHMEPLHAIGVFPLGVWLGIVAWRSGSIWPAMLAHTFNNSFAVFLTRLQPQEGDAVADQMAAGFLVLTALAVSAICLVISCAVLVQKKTEPIVAVAG